MIRIAKQTQFQPEEIIVKAVKFFGKEGGQLEEKERTACGVSFEGSGGYVAISVSEENKLRTVDIETREFEYAAKRFIQML
jgi:hypothetical protein